MAGVFFTMENIFKVSNLNNMITAVLHRDHIAIVRFVVEVLLPRYKARRASQQSRLMHLYSDVSKTALLPSKRAFNQYDIWPDKSAENGSEHFYHLSTCYGACLFQC